MKILWFNWKDKKNPKAGGAEIVNEEIAKRLVKDGHEVIIVTAKFKDCKREEKIDGYKVIRVGNRYTVYVAAFIYYLKNLRGWADLVIDEVNTIPFFCKYYVKEKNILFIHQLAREVWFYQMFFPLSILGYLLEPLYLYLLSDRKVITVSHSTKEDLLRFGFKEENISIISEGIEIEPIKDLSLVEKFSSPTILSFGSIRPMKRTLEILKAFEVAKQENPNLKLIIAGDNTGKYAEKFMKEVNKSKYNQDISVLGRVSEGEKINLMRKSHIICVTSIKEGWGLIVTEANSQGTPAVVYNVDGLRDSVINEVTGLVTIRNSPESLAEGIVSLLRNKVLYSSIRESCLKFSKSITFDGSFKMFANIIYNQDKNNE